MKCRIDVSKVGIHIKAALVKAKVVGMQGEIVDHFSDIETVVVLFKKDNEGNTINKTFALYSRAVMVETEKPEYNSNQSSFNF